MIPLREKPHIPRDTLRAWVCLLALGGGAQPSEGLTIYRIGGEDRPPPVEVAAGDAQLVQLSWQEGADGEGGAQEGMEVNAEGIAPLFFSAGENVTPLIDELGGRLQTRYTFDFIHDKSEPIHKVADGDPATSYEELTPLGPYFRVKGRSFYFDLGLEVPVQAVRFYPPQGKELRTIDHIFVATGFEGMEIPEGSTVGQGPYLYGFDEGDSAMLYLQRKGIILELVREIEENASSVVEIPLSGEPRRHVLVHMAPQTAIWEIAELEIIAAGFLPEALYRTEVLDLGGPASLGPLRWAGRQDAEARVRMRSRAGGDDTPNIYWRRTFRGSEQVTTGPSGELLARRDYERLEIAQRGAITHDAANWDTWSAAYEFGDSLGIPLRADDLRSHLQLEVAFTSFGSLGGRLGFVEFAVSPPLVTRLVGEVSPSVAEIGSETAFTFAVRPTIEPGDPGFDGAELRFAGGRFTAVEEVRIDSEVVVSETVELTEGRAFVRFPRLDVAHSGELLEIDVRGEIFRTGASLQGRAFDSDAPGEVGQRVPGGEATEWLDGNSLVIEGARLDEHVLGDVVLPTAVVTPNGDGIHDELEIGYTVLKVTEPAAVRVLVYDLQGSLVREVYAGGDRAGRYGRPWNGRDSAGRLVAPGLYICRVEVDTDRRQERRTVVAAVAY